MLVVQEDGIELPWSEGAAQFISEPYGGHKYFVGVRCQLGNQEVVEIAQLDTAAEWSVVSADVAAALENDLGEPLDEIVMHTRFGQMRGLLRRVRISLLADEGLGDNVDVDGTILVIPDWPGPVMLGFRGFLERLKIAIDPGADAAALSRIYFGAYV